MSYFEIILLSASMIQGFDAALETTFVRIGLNPDMDWVSLFPHLVTPVLFIGPLYARYVGGSLPFQRDWTFREDFVLNFISWQGARNYVLVSRASPLLRAQLQNHTAWHVDRIPRKHAAGIKMMRPVSSKNRAYVWKSGFGLSFYGCTILNPVVWFVNWDYPSYLYSDRHFGIPQTTIRTATVADLHNYISVNELYLNSLLRSSGTNYRGNCIPSLCPGRLSPLGCLQNAYDFSWAFVLWTWCV